MRQEDFATALGVKKSHISNIENDLNSLSFEKLYQIMQTFQIDARYFFDQLDSPEEADLSKRGEDPKTSPLERLEKKIDKVSEKIIPIDSVSKDYALKRVLDDSELRDFVEMLIENRGEVGRLRGYLDRVISERAKPVQRDARQTGELGEEVGERSG